MTVREAITLLRQVKDKDLELVCRYHGGDDDNVSPVYDIRFGYYEPEEGSDYRSGQIRRDMKYTFNCVCLITVG